MPTSVIELPLSLPGRVFGSPMPFNDKDPYGKLLELYSREGIDVIVMLVDIEESIRETGYDLLNLYRQKGIDVIYFPISDFGIPEREDLITNLDRTFEKALDGKNILVHCNGGLGRTGMFLACFVKRALGLSGEQAISWVRERIPGAVETDSQYKMVLDC